jgi:hypothetical protein
MNLVTGLNRIARNATNRMAMLTSVKKKLTEKSSIGRLTYLFDDYQDGHDKAIDGGRLRQRYAQKECRHYLAGRFRLSRDGFGRASRRYSYPDPRPESG